MRKETIRSGGIITLGSVIFALAFDAFFAPTQVAMGGITGLAQIINLLVPGLSVGLLAFLLNVPLFLAGWKFIGFRLLAPSLFAMAPPPSTPSPSCTPSRPWTPCWPPSAAAP